MAALVSQLDVIRSAWGGPLRVVSGYRTPAWNMRIDGARFSQHVEGKAADIQPMVVGDAMQVRVQELHNLILRLMADGQLPLVGGLGYYPNKWVHVDIRARPPDGHIAMWHGAGIGSEVA